MRRADRDCVQVGQRMRVRIHASGEHEAASRVDRVGDASCRRRRDLRDVPVPHDQIALDETVGGDDPAAHDRAGTLAHDWHTRRVWRSIERIRASAPVTVSTAATPATPKPRRAPPVSMSSPDSQPPIGEPARKAK